jgi:hypothetical protein
MAIVIVVIGLITSLAVKGNDLMDQVTWKRDVQSLEHLQAALLLFKEGRGHLPGDVNNDGTIQGRENYLAFEELRTTAGLEKKDFTFKTGGPMYFLFTECDKVDDGYAVVYKGEPKGTCIFPSEKKPWELKDATNDDILSYTNTKQMLCMYEVGFDDKNVFTGNVRIPSKTDLDSRGWGSYMTWDGEDLNGRLADIDSPFDCFSSDFGDEPTGTKKWGNVVVIGLW